MTTNTSQENKVLINTASYVPAISVIMPFEPMMSGKSEPEYKLKKVVQKIETELMSSYPVEKVLPVMHRLQSLLSSLNYTSLKKSIAIFVSPITEKVYYLDIPVEEKVVIDESFELRDLIYSKKQNSQYLVLLLSSDRSTMYRGNCTKFNLIKSNMPEDIHAYENNAPEKVANFSDPDKRKEILIDKFLHHMDEGLSLVLNADDLPVFVLGPEKVLGHFRKITRNAEKLVAFIHGNYNEATETEIREVLEPYLQNWKKIKQQAVLQLLENARNSGKVSAGIHAVEKAVKQKNTRLLIIEKNFIFPPRSGSGSEEASKVLPFLNNPFYIKDAVDDIIEKVLQNGGDAEFVENGMLNEYNKIALIRYY